MKAASWEKGFKTITFKKLYLLIYQKEKNGKINLIAAHIHQLRVSLALGPQSLRNV